MKHRRTNRFILTWMLTAMLVISLIGCTDSSEDNKVVSEDNKVVSEDNKVVSEDNKVVSEDKTSIEGVKQETQDLIQALGDYTADQQDEAIEKTKTALDKLDKHIAALETRIDDNWDQMNKAAREKARANLQALRKQRTEVAEWYC